MYGTIARLRLKSGMESKLQELMQELDLLDIDGYVDTIIFRMDADQNEYFMGVIFEDKDSYVTNADSTAQDARYNELLELLETEPEWHDGQIVYMGG
jgi:hypothetical protein